MSTVSVGNYAEQKAADYLRNLGFNILEQNYRRPYCEIDIVAHKADSMYFVEVKYRATNRFGAGLDYIAGQKLHHMQRGAETWIASHKWDGEYQLSAIEVCGPHYDVTEFIESVWE